MVREFKLVNEKGQEYSLMDIEKYCLLTDPSGLGYSYATEYKKVGNAFVESLRQIEQGTFSGTINTLYYDNYKELVDFIETSEKLRLFYKIPFKNGSKNFYKNIKIQSLGKTEKSTSGVISEPISFDCVSLWYEEIINVFDMSMSPSNEIRFDFKWDSRFSDYNRRKIKYINKGHVEAPVIIEIDGYVKNPKISLYVEGEIYQELNLNVTIEKFEKFLYSTVDDDFYMRKRETNGIEKDLFNFDVISEDDFKSKDLNVRFPINKSCELKIESENNIESARITVLQLYKSI